LILALLCSGQGGQHPRMFELAAGMPEAEPLFRMAAPLLGGRDARELVHTAERAELESNSVAQILCVLSTVAMFRSLGDVSCFNTIVAGYSVGELAAWAIAGALTAADVLNLVQVRASAMDAVTGKHDGLLSIRGLALPKLQQLCRQTDTDIAIINPQSVHIVGGEVESLEVLADLCRRAGAQRITTLPVHVASHTPRMAKASEVFGQRLLQLQDLRALAPTVRLLSGVDGQAVFDLREGLRKLAAQLSHTVNWAACLQSCAEAGASAFLELGPGRSLSLMAKEAAPAIEARSIEDFRSLEGVKAWLRRLA